ncbi:MAG: HPr family phosphocarrier protein [Caldisericaceae bacterium]
MEQREFVIQNKVGLHARPAAVLVQTANRFKSNITIAKDGRVVSAKSIIGVLSLGAEKGCVITVETEGVDEQEAMKSIETLVNENFGDAE